MTYQVDDVADTLITLARVEGIPVSNLKLQKLTYYAQAWNLVFYDRPVFNDDFEAWVHGPVVPRLFRRFRHYGWKPIEDNVTAMHDTELQTHLKKILEAYGKYAASDLERLSHSESPWIDARQGLPPDVSTNRVISKESMKLFYARKVNATRQA